MSYGRHEVLRAVTLDLPAGAVVTITGPNGAGKSTLLSILGGLRREYAGSCRFHDREVRGWTRRAFAQQVSVVPQRVQMEFPFTAEQVVTMGRTPFCNGLFESPEDHAAVERAMQITDTVEFRSRDFRSLSGGERQRVVLASALAQTPRVLLLDEPTTFLDPEHQVSLFRILRGLAGKGVLVVAVTHDLNIAARCSDRLIMLRAGEMRAAGRPAEVLEPATIRNVFSVDAQIHQTPAGIPWIFYGD
ncbi:MAG TPA: ABC transporter ATP-binding protein [Bryobacteraceae bacterium]|nr:ABC transporter ATP-binding protein [Bryobacteraceae bacterium]